MSRVAKNPIVIPTGVDITIGGGELVVKGPKGTLKQKLAPSIDVIKQDNSVVFSARSKDRKVIAMSGTLRALTNNMVIGVTKGFEKKLSLVGVGYRAQAQGKALNLTLGFSHPVSYQVPEGITIETPSQTEILIKGVKKEQVGQVAAEIRAYRAPEPYKGKGVRYSDEQIVLKEAKKK